MSHDQVTIAIPTYNRSKLLKFCIESTLDQDYKNIQVIVLDNASSDDTEDIVKGFDDPRITYVRNSVNVGLFQNWNRGIEVNKNPYLCLLQDDDVLLPGFVSASCKALCRNSSAAFSFTYASGIDIEGREIGIQNASGLSEGTVKGLDYLHRIVAGDDFVIHPTSVLMRSAALSQVGLFDTTHSKHSIDFNLYFRLAAKYDMVFIPEYLVQIRRHKEADHITSTKGCGPVSMTAERMDAAAYLLQSSRADDKSYRLWLAQRLLDLSMLRSGYTSELLPDLNLSWFEKREIARRELENMLPEGSTIILIDQDALSWEDFRHHDILPFIGKNGCYWGPPASDAEALLELEKMHPLKARYLVFAWPAFWWFDHYKAFREYLLTHFRCLCKNSRLIIFELLPAHT
jgi:glycosyltransferase involved in cell wall biosynthesis